MPLIAKARSANMATTARHPHRHGPYARRGLASSAGSRTTTTPASRRTDSSSAHHTDRLICIMLLGKLLSARKVSLLVQLQYLKTYTNAGLVELYVCDQKVDSIDALWADEHMRVSVSESFAASVAVDLSSIIQQDRWCPAAAPDEKMPPLVRIEHVNRTYGFGQYEHAASTSKDQTN